MYADKTGSGGVHTPVPKGTRTCAHASPHTPPDRHSLLFCLRENRTLRTTRRAVFQSTSRCSRQAHRYIDKRVGAPSACGRATHCGSQQSLGDVTAEVYHHGRAAFSSQQGHQGTQRGAAQGPKAGTSCAVREGLHRYWVADQCSLNAATRLVGEVRNRG